MKVAKPNDLQISSLKIQSFEANSELFASSLTLLSTNLCFLKDISLLDQALNNVFVPDELTGSNLQFLEMDYTFNFQT